MSEAAARVMQIVVPAQRRLVERACAALSINRVPGVLGLNPRPLILPGRAPGGGHLMVVWSPKSACTHVVAWALRHEGLLGEALAHDSWVHHYRTDRYYDRPEHRAATEEVIASRGAGHCLLRVTRSPFTRMVSILNHAARSPGLWPEIDAALGGSVADDGLSLSDLDRFMSARDLTAWSTTNAHFCVQDHPVLGLRFDRRIVVNIDETSLDEALADLDREIGAPTEELGNRRDVRRINRRRRYAKDTAYDEEGPIEARRFRRDELDRFPKSDLLASGFLRDVTDRHHGVDVGRVGSGDTAGRLALRPAA